MKGYVSSKVSVPNLQDDALRWSWCNNNRNEVHNKSNVLESSPNHPSHPQSMIELPFTKPVPGAKKIGDRCSKAQVTPQSRWRGTKAITETQVNLWCFCGPQSTQPGFPMHDLRAVFSGIASLPPLTRLSLIYSCVFTIVLHHENQHPEHIGAQLLLPR